MANDHWMALFSIAQSGNFVVVYQTIWGVKNNGVVSMSSIDSIEPINPSLCKKDR